ncbi:MAG: LapA family protein [Spirochaetales bacterium]|nr:LapA family protein [Spirochaetales bacterium]
MKLLYLLILLLVAIVAVLFAAQNSAQVAISFFAWTATGSLSLVLILTLSLGILIGILIMAPSAFKRTIQSSGLKRKLSRMEKEKKKLSAQNSQASEAEATPKINDGSASPPPGLS